jgi:hypothetical protein
MQRKLTSKLLAVRVHAKIPWPMFEFGPNFLLQPFRKYYQSVKINTTFYQAYRSET